MAKIQVSMEIRQCAGCEKTFGVKDDSQQDFCSTDCEKINGGRSGKWGHNKRKQKEARAGQPKRSRRVTGKLIFIDESVLKVVEDKARKQREEGQWKDYEDDEDGL